MIFHGLLLSQGTLTQWLVVLLGLPGGLWMVIQIRDYLAGPSHPYGPEEVEVLLGQLREDVKDGLESIQDSMGEGFRGPPYRFPTLEDDAKLTLSNHLSHFLEAEHPSLYEDLRSIQRLRKKYVDEREEFRCNLEESVQGTLLGAHPPPNVADHQDSAATRSLERRIEENRWAADDPFWSDDFFEDKTAAAITTYLMGDWSDLEDGEIIEFRGAFRFRFQSDSTDRQIQENYKELWDDLDMDPTSLIDLSDSLKETTSNALDKIEDSEQQIRQDYAII